MNYKQEAVMKQLHSSITVLYAVINGKINKNNFL
jgi:hypothetical protein